MLYLTLVGRGGGCCGLHFVRGLRTPSTLLWTASPRTDRDGLRCRITSTHSCSPHHHHHHPQLTDKDPGLGGAAPDPHIRRLLQLSKLKCILAILDLLGLAEPSFPRTKILGCVLWFHGCLRFAQPKLHVFPIAPLWCHSRTLMMALLVLCHWYFEARVRDVTLIGLCRAQRFEKKYFWGVYCGFWLCGLYRAHATYLLHFARFGVMVVPL